MTKVIFQTPEGMQYCTELGPGGALGPALKVIWEEKVDGPLPAMADYEVVSKSGKTLVVDQAKVDAKKLRLQAAKAVKDAEDAEKAAFLLLKSKINDDTATAADLRSALKYLLKRLPV